MNYQTAIAAIKRHFAEEWAERTPVAYPDDKSFNTPNGTPWVRLTVQPVYGYQASVGAPGNNYFRRDGLITVQLFTPTGGGEIEAYQLVDQLVPVFQRVGRVDGIAFRDVRVNPVGNTPDGWYHVNVKAEFEYDTIA